MTKLKRNHNKPKESQQQLTHYETLGVYPGASIEEIHRTFKNLAVKAHPDKGGDTAKFQRLTLAFGVLKTNRTQYDAQLRLAGKLNCGVCEGKGFVERSKSFTRTERKPCPQCHGRGDC